VNWLELLELLDAAAASPGLAAHAGAAQAPEFANFINSVNSATTAGAWSALLVPLPLLPMLRTVVVPIRSKSLHEVSSGASRVDLLLARASVTLNGLESRLWCDPIVLVSANRVNVFFALQGATGMGFSGDPLRESAVCRTGEPASHADGGVPPHNREADRSAGTEKRPAGNFAAVVGCGCMCDSQDPFT
jgi:hypothetical protein